MPKTINRKGNREINIRYVFFVCLFVILRPTGEFFTHLGTSPLLVKGYKFDIYMYSALMAIEQ